MSAGTVLAFEGVSLVAGGVRLFDGLTFTLAAGERLAILGDSGEGKSMIARLAIGLAVPMTGTVRLFGDPIDLSDQDRLRSLRGRCGLVLQGGSLIGSLSVENNLWLGLGAAAAARPRLQRKLDRAMVEFEIEHLATAVAGTLSSGERRRIELARAFLRDPHLVILDEPMEGARAHGDRLETRIRRQVVSRGRALLLLTQDAAMAARLCDRVLRIEHGRLVQQGDPVNDPVGEAVAAA